MLQTVKPRARLVRYYGWGMATGQGSMRWRVTFGNSHVGTIGSDLGETVRRAYRNRMHMITGGK